MHHALTRFSRLAAPIPWLLAAACATSAPPRTRTASAKPEPVSPLEASAAFPALLGRPSGGMAGCVVVNGRDGLRLGSPITPATRDLPPTLEVMSPMLGAAPGAARVLTPSGRLGPDGDGPVLVSLTRVPLDVRRRPALAMFLSEGGLELRSIQEIVTEPPPGEQPLSSLPQTLGSLAHGPSTLFLAADATVTGRTLVEALAALPSSAFVVLAGALPAGTRLPPEVEPDPAQRAACAGLPDPDPELHEGDLAQSTLLAGLEPLPERLHGCLSSANWVESAVVNLTMRVSDGHVTEACLLDDAPVDPLLAACFLAHVRQLRFGEGEPGTFVDLVLPLRVAPLDDPQPAPLCHAP